MGIPLIYHCPPPTIYPIGGWKLVEFRLILVHTLEVSKIGAF